MSGLTAMYPVSSNEITRRPPVNPLSDNAQRTCLSVELEKTSAVGGTRNSVKHSIAINSSAFRGDATIDSLPLPRPLIRSIATNGNRRALDSSRIGEARRDSRNTRGHRRREERPSVRSVALHILIVIIRYSAAIPHTSHCSANQTIVNISDCVSLNDGGEVGTLPGRGARVDKERRALVCTSAPNNS
jgi:hypothetical protein